MLHEIDLAETRGTGVRRMRKRMQAAGLRLPELVSDRAGNRFRLTLSFHHLLDEADWSWLGRFEGLDDTDRQVMWLALRPEGVRNEDVRAVSTDDTLGASGRLGRLRDRGLLVRRGEAKQNAWYVVAPEHRPDRAEPVDLDGKPIDLDGKPIDLDGKPVDLAPAEDLSADLRARIAALPRKAGATQVEPLLLKLCGLRWWEPGELARLLGRNRTYLLNHYLKPLVERGELVLYHQDRKHHPRQAYGRPGLRRGGEE
jgi:ATP-dependent DNA helicase RecG